jgi:hypothetical protein
MILHLAGIIKFNRRDGSADSLSPSWATLRQAPFDRLRTQLRLRSGCTQDRLVLKRQKRAETAESNEPDIDYPVEQVAKVSDERSCG